MRKLENPNHKASRRGRFCSDPETVRRLASICQEHPGRLALVGLVRGYVNSTSTTLTIDSYIAGRTDTRPRIILTFEREADFERATKSAAAALEKREQLESAATALRGFCNVGAAVLVASAVARQKASGGSTCRGLNLASFRGSSELEYGCDGAYAQERGDPNDGQNGSA
jgi:hypothetical protein